jgi:hypothetical protein
MGRRDSRMFPDAAGLRLHLKCANVAGKRTPRSGVVLCAGRRDAGRAICTCVSTCTVFRPTRAATLPRFFQRTRRDSNPRLLPPEPKYPARIAWFFGGFGRGARRHGARRGSFKPPLGTSGPERHRALCSARRGGSMCIDPRADPRPMDSQRPWLSRPGCQRSKIF